MAWRTDYLGIHESRYRRLREKGAGGWSDEDDVGDLSDLVLQTLARQGLGTGSLLLELGCGEGRATLRWVREGFRTVGADLSPSAVAWAADLARSQGLPPRFVRADVRSLPFPAGAFDAVVDGRCLHCIIGDDRTLFLSEAFRVLRPEGLLIVASMCGDYLPPEVLETCTFDTSSRCLVQDGVAGRYLGTPECIAEEVLGAGFQLIWKELRRAEEEPDDLRLAVRRPA